MPNHFFLPAVLVVVLYQSAAAAAERPAEFNRDIRPLLSDRCFQCHGPDEEARQANLRFDIPSDEEGPFAARDEFPAITPKKLEESALWLRITAVDPGERMPPADSHKEPLSNTELELFRSWILQGAEYEEFWAFSSPRPQSVPDTEHWDAASGRIDRFVLARLDREGLVPSPVADKRTLIRRVTLDLTGLPPTRHAIREFLEDTAPNAYARLVDRLLNSPRYGEHFAKYWLDLVRFADTNGIHHDHYREMTPYRDWVIRAFNENLSFSDFIAYQVAGDLFESPTIDQQIASGFHRLHLVIDKGTALPEESFARNVIDRTAAVGTALMGLTVQCAVCHDHKYDPLTQKEFYQLFAFFNNIDSEPETPGSSIHEPSLLTPSEAQSIELASLEEKIAGAASELDSLTQQPRPSHESSLEAAALSAAVKTKQQQLAEWKAAQAALLRQIPVTLVMRERDEIRPAHILIRGAYDRPGARVERGTPAFLPPLGASGGVKTRMDLARWLTDAEHPLTARVAVNRFWQQFFGVGIVKTSEDFGAQGEWPSHLGLLDDLATRFAASGWDVKGLVRSIVLSRTYQQSSHVDPLLLQVDPRNRLLTRGSRFRLDSEVIRDQILAISGLLDQSMYGRSVKPPQPPGLWKSVSMVSSSTYSFEPDAGADIRRRSVYTFWKRALPPPQMTIFDAPTRESCTARRERTNTPLQALVLMNEQQYFHAALDFAKQLVASERSEEQRIRDAFESVTSRLPGELEMQSLRRGLRRLRATYLADLHSAAEMTVDSPLTIGERVEVASYTMLVNALFNLDATKTRE